MVAQVLREKRGLTLLAGGVKTPREKLFRPYDRTTLRRINPRTNKVAFIPAIYPYDDGGSVS